MLKLLVFAVVTLIGLGSYAQAAKKATPSEEVAQPGASQPYVQLAGDDDDGDDRDDHDDDDGDDDDGGDDG